MANEEHLAIFNQGIEIWNAWRNENPCVKPDLSGAKFERVVHIGFHSRDFSHTDLNNPNIEGARLFGCDLSGAELIGAVLLDADLSGANLRNSNLSHARLARADLNLAELDGANLYQLELRGATLFGASLRGCNLAEADLVYANLSGADLERADLSRAMLNRTTLAETNLSGAMGMDSVMHVGPSSIGLDTVYQTSGQFPEVFLRGCGLSDSQIAMVRLHQSQLTEAQITDTLYDLHHLLAGDAIRYHSCFISYAHQDQPFAQRIHDDLQNSGVRCWFAPEDMKIGDPIHTAVDFAIHHHEKLLLILSKHAIQSSWVEQQIATALEKEDDTGEQILFPIRLDDTPFNLRAGIIARIKRTRHIGDFRNWKDEAQYQQAFTRALRDLQAQEN